MLKQPVARVLLLTSLALASACGHQRPQPEKPQAQRVFTSDVDTFWAAYDSARATTDSVRQVQLVQRLYVDRGTPGVRAFMAAKDYTAERWVGLIRRYPKFWASIRPNTYRAKVGARGLAAPLAKLRTLYPALRPASIYFAIGALGSSGTTQDSLVLIGAELVTGTPETDISEFPPRLHAFLARYYGGRPFTNVVFLNVHEYVHTQQHGEGNTLLARAIREGSADWITELATGTRLPLPYMTYGPAHEAELKERFRTQLFSPWINGWFYDQQSDDPRHVADLGYYMGYAISRAYYDCAPDKQRAAREMIELNFDNDDAAEAFLRRSGYYPGLADKPALLQAYEERRPVVTRVTPAIIGDSVIDARTKELRVEFSAVMAPTTGTGFGPGGKAQWPITGRVGFSADKRAYTYQVDLTPGRTYDFVVEGGGFRSADGYALRPYEVKFRTKNTKK